MPTIPNDIAQIAGINTLDVPPINTWAVITGQNNGNSAISSAPTAKATTPAATRARFAPMRSTSAPAGVCITIPVIPPTVSAKPTCCSFHLKSAR